MNDKYKPMNKRTLHLRFKMSELDNAIADCSEEVKECIDNVWEEIDNLEYKDMTWDSLAEQGHSPKMIESILAKQG